MPQHSEGSGHNAPKRPEKTLDEILGFFRTNFISQRWTYEELHKAFFKERLSLGAVKDYLAGKLPVQPRPDTITGFRNAYRQAIAEGHPAHRLHREILTAVGCADPSESEIALYEGEYAFFRIGPHGLVKGVVEIGRHAEAGVPYHTQVHSQATDESDTFSTEFRYEGSIIWLARNLCLLCVKNGELRLTLIPRVSDPRLKQMVGQFLTEEFDSRDPFAGKVLLCHAKWIKNNGDLLKDEAWIRKQLKNKAPKNKDDGQDLLR